MAKKEKGTAIVGADYPTDRLRNPWSAGVGNSWFGSEKDKTVHSPASTTWEPDLKIHAGYDELWKGK